MEGGPNPGEPPLHLTLQQYLQEPHLRQKEPLTSSHPRWQETRGVLVNLMTEVLEGFPRTGLWYNDTALAAKAAFDLLDLAMVSMEGVYRGEGQEQAWLTKILFFVGTMEYWTHQEPISGDNPTPSELRDMALKSGSALLSAIKNDVTIAPDSNLVSQTFIDFTTECIDLIDEMVDKFADSSTASSASFRISVFTKPRITQVTIFSDQATPSTFVVSGPAQTANVLISLLQLLTCGIDPLSDNRHYMDEKMQRRLRHTVNIVMQFCISAAFPSRSPKIVMVKRLLELNVHPKLQLDYHIHIGRILSWRLIEGPDPEWKNLDSTLAQTLRQVMPAPVQSPLVSVILDLMKEPEVSEDFSLRSACYAYITRTADFISPGNLRDLKAALANDHTDDGQRTAAAIDLRLLSNDVGEQMASGKKRRRHDDIRKFIQASISLCFPRSTTSVELLVDGTEEEWNESVLAALQAGTQRALRWPDEQSRLECANLLARLPCSLCHSEYDKCTERIKIVPEQDVVSVALRYAEALLVEPCPDKVWHPVLGTMASFVRHSNLPRNCIPSISSLLQRGLKHPTRSIRLEAGKVVKAVADVASSVEIGKYLVALVANVSMTDEQKLKETALVSLTLLARSEVLDVQGAAIMGILRQLGNCTGFIQAHAYSQLLSVARYHERGSFALISPHMAEVSRFVVSNIRSTPTYITEICRFLNLGIEDLLNISQIFVLPHLVGEMAKDALEAVASYLGKPIGGLLLPHASKIIAHLLMLQPRSKSQKATQFLANLMVGGASGFQVLVMSHRIEIISELVISLADKSKHACAVSALDLLQGALNQGAATEPLESFLQPVALGILSQMNTAIITSRGPAATPYKQQVIRGLGHLVQLVGKDISAVTPQIMAFLLGTLTSPELTEPTLETWLRLVQVLDFKDFGPHVGPTSAAIVGGWPSFSTVSRDLATKIIDHVFKERDVDSQRFLDDAVSLHAIPELGRAHAKLLLIRKNQSFERQLEILLGRCGNENPAISLQSLDELKAFMINNANQFEALSSGDNFSPLIGDIVDTLFQCSCRDGEEFEDVRQAAFACIGTLGAIDPDRFDLIPEPSTRTILFNYTQQDENMEFILHLIRDVLSGAYRGASDINYQTNLAYALQELMRQCGFTIDLVQKPHRKLSSTMVDRWNRLPKNVAETIAALLDGRLTSPEMTVAPMTFPIYHTVATYREWIQRWSRHLISRAKEPGATSIFLVFRNVVRHQDVTIARHLMPHLVLHIVISGEDQDRDSIRTEITAVLNDQVDSSSQSSADKRLLSAQTVFNVMDHVSKWIREARQEFGKQDKKSRISGSNIDGVIVQVESFMSSIYGDITATAALETKAFARALMNYEMLVFQKRAQHQAEDSLQDYYGKLHEIYAQLDDPDGMQGVSSLVLSPSLEHQIREHESVGRWTAAQSCWEMKLQSSPSDLDSHIGLIRCLRNLGHYDTMDTHIRGVLSRNPEWADALAGYKAESSWMKADWAGVEEAVQTAKTTAPEISLARVLIALKKADDGGVQTVLAQSRRDLVVHLHLVRDLEMVHETRRNISSLLRGGRAGKAPRTLTTCTTRLAARFESTLPTFRAREPILSMRRVALGILVPTIENAKRDISRAWLDTAKIARKARHFQTAYSAVLQAKGSGDPFSFVESCKLVRADGETYRALQELEGAIARLPHDDEFANSNTRAISKALVLLARWRNEAGRFDQKDLVYSFKQAIQTSNEWESPYFHLGRYHDEIRGQVSNPAQVVLHTLNTCKNFALALQYGSKYIYHTLPRLLTLWLDTAEQPDILRIEQSGGPVSQHGTGELFKIYLKLVTTIEIAISRLPAYKWFTALPQIISRIEHPSKKTHTLLGSLVIQCIREYTGQALWLFSCVVHSRRPLRSKRGSEILSKARSEPTHNQRELVSLLDNWLQMSRQIIVLSEYQIDESDNRPMSLKQQCPFLAATTPSKLILPLQSSMTASLPSRSSTQGNYQPFPPTAPTFSCFVEEIAVMKSLVKPKKLGVKGSDGNIYNFLCKPKDDLRKDCRLMDLFAIINKLLKANSESRRRRLRIRTYCVVPLDEECGMLEWVPNTIPMRPILEELYAPQPIFTREVGAGWKRVKENGVEASYTYFVNTVLPLYPPVFSQWFIANFAEPTAWLSARQSFSRTYGVMAMVGHILGLGDRHGENILLDFMNGDAMHVDFNCIFDKGKTLQVPELVPFRLTQNVVNAMGVTGVEGAFRISCEVSMQTLRDNKDSLMSVLEAFVHDPLVEWENERKRELKRASGRKRNELENAPVNLDAKAVAQRSLRPIERKLKGLPAEDDHVVQAVSVSNQVDTLIREASSIHLLSQMYVGWCPWL